MNQRLLCTLVYTKMATPGWHSSIYMSRRLQASKLHVPLSNARRFPERCSTGGAAAPVLSRSGLACSASKS